MVEKSLDIISINGKHDWRDRLFDGLVDSIDEAAPVIAPCPMQPLPLIGDLPAGRRFIRGCSGKTTGVVPFLRHDRGEVCLCDDTG